MKHLLLALAFLGAGAAQADDGMINPITGEYYPRVGPNGYINPRTGEFYPIYQDPRVPVDRDEQPRRQAQQQEPECMAYLRPDTGKYALRCK